MLPMRSPVAIVLNGKPHALGGTFFEPTLITDVTTDAQLCCEETFDPSPA